MAGFIKVKPSGQISYEKPYRPASIFIRPGSRAVCNLFGSPEKGEISVAFTKVQNQNVQQVKDRFILLDILPNSTSGVTTAASNGSESRLGQENLIEKERREYEKKLSNKKNDSDSVNCDEILVVDYINSHSLKPEEIVTRKIVDTTSPKCSSNGERPKPYSKKQASVAEYYNQRKPVVCNNSRTSDMHSLEEANGLLPPLSTGFEDTYITSAVITNESSSPSSLPTRQCEQEQSASIIVHD